MVTKKEKKKHLIEKILTVLAWITGVLIFVTFGSLMIRGVLVFPGSFGGEIVSKILGWIILSTVIFLVGRKIFKK